MECVQCREAVSARFDEELLPVAGADLDDHLASCTDCSRFAEEIAALHRKVRPRPPVAVNDLTPAIIAAVSASTSTSPVSSSGIPEPARTAVAHQGLTPSRRVLAAAGAVTRRGDGRRRRRSLVAAGCVVVGIVACLWWTGGRSASPAEVEIASGYVTVDPDGTGARVYLDVINTGGADVIVGATSPVAAAAALHATTIEDGLVSMVPRREIPVPANGAVTFQPGGAHVMLAGLRTTASFGDEIPVTVELADSTSVTVVARVVDPVQLAGLVGGDPAGS